MENIKKRKIAFISAFARKGHDSTQFSAIGSYSKTLLNTLNTQDRENIEVLAQIEPNETGYEYDGLLVSRVWRKDNLLFFLELLFYVMRKGFKVVHIQQEVYCFAPKYAPYISPYLLVLLQLLLRLLGIKVIVTIHGVVPLAYINKDFTENNKVATPLIITRHGLKTLYYGLVSTANKVIVHNELIKGYLINDYGANVNKIIVIPLPLYTYPENKKNPDILQKLKDQKKKIILFFGYLAPYKGLDTFIKAFQSFNLSENNAVALISGSIPKRLVNDPKYLKWLEDLKELSSKISKDIIWDQRFIPDNEIQSYFINADIVVVPYSEGIASSGPLAHSVNANKPTLLSEVFRDVVDDTLIFGNTSEELGSALSKFFLDNNFKDTLLNMVNRQKELWSSRNIGKLTHGVYRELFVNEIKYD